MTPPLVHGVGTTMHEKNPAAIALGRLGGLRKSAAKTAAARRNARLPRRRNKRAKDEAPSSGVEGEKQGTGQNVGFEVAQRAQRDCK